MHARATLRKSRRAGSPPGVPHAYLVTSDVTQTLVLVTPDSGAMEAFFREAGEPAAQRKLPDAARIAAVAERTGAVNTLGPPPFATPDGG